MPLQRNGVGFRATVECEGTDRWLTRAVTALSAAEVVRA